MMDPVEFSSALPSTGTSSDFFIKPTSNNDFFFKINIFKPLININSEIYYLKTRLYYEATLTNEAEAMIEFEIVPKCSYESIITSALTDISYTFDSAASITILAPMTSTLPLKCLVSYTLEYKDPVLLNFGSIASISSFTTFDNFTRSLTLDYHVDNRYSQLNIDNIYEMKLTGCLWGDVC